MEFPECEAKSRHGKNEVGNSMHWRSGAAEDFMRAWTHLYLSLAPNQKQQYQKEFPTPKGKWKKWYMALEAYVVRHDA